MAESVVAALECKLLDRTRSRKPDEARLTVFEFIEGWYNPHRRHPAIGHWSPIRYENATAGMAALIFMPLTDVSRVRRNFTHMRQAGPIGIPIHDANSRPLRILRRIFPVYSHEAHDSAITEIFALPLR